MPIPILFRREFCDVPRCFVVRHRGVQLLFDCPFDDELDDYPGQYSVYVMPDLPDSRFEMPNSWFGIAQEATKFLGTVPVAAVEFDATRRQSIGSQIVDELLEGEAELEER